MGVRIWVVLGAFVMPLSGCPGGAELEDSDRFQAWKTGTAGAAGSAGTAGAAGSAGIGGGGIGGSSGSGGALTFLPPNCDYRGILLNQCGKTCHQTTPNNPKSPIAGLDLVADGVEARLYGQRPSYKDIACPDADGGVIPVSCVPPTCDKDALLIAPGNPSGSFVLQKIMGTHGDCGRVMPISPGKLDDTTRECLEDWIEAVANATITP